MNHQRKIFVGLSLDEKAKQFIAKKIKSLKFPESENIKWIDPENYHITLMFLGYVKDEDIPGLCRSLREAFQGCEDFDAYFGKIRKVPKEGNAKMIWLEGRETPELTDLKNKTEKTLSHHKGDYKKFIPHITLARIKKPKETIIGKEANKEIRLIIPVRSAEVMESVIENGRRTYYVLESIPLEDY